MHALWDSAKATSGEETLPQQPHLFQKQNGSNRFLKISPYHTRQCIIVAKNILLIFVIKIWIFNPRMQFAKYVFKTGPLQDGIVVYDWNAHIH